MTSTTADKIIGRTLYARQPVTLLNNIFKPITTIQTGNIIGVVWSYIQRDGQLYWQFKKPGNVFQYVKHDANKIELSQADKAELKNIEETEKLKQRGVVPYYIEKYGLWILGAIAVITLGKEIIKKKV